MTRIHTHTRACIYITIKSLILCRSHEAVAHLYAMSHAVELKLRFHIRCENGSQSAARQPGSPATCRCWSACVVRGNWHKCQRKSVNVAYNGNYVCWVMWTRFKCVAVASASAAKGAFNKRYRWRWLVDSLLRCMCIYVAWALDYFAVKSTDWLTMLWFVFAFVVIMYTFYLMIFYRARQALWKVDFFKKVILVCV